MNNKQKGSVVAVIALVIAVVSLIVILLSRGSDQKFPLGAAGGLLAENYIPYIMYNGGYNSAKSISTTADLTVGSSGTAVTTIIKGTCTLTGTDISLAASSSAPYFCAATGVVSGDTVFVTLATSTSQFSNGWVLVGAKASTTSGFIDVVISNLTGTSRVPSATSVGSSTQYLILR